MKRLCVAVLLLASLFPLGLCMLAAYELYPMRDPLGMLRAYSGAMLVFYALAYTGVALRTPMGVPRPALADSLGLLLPVLFGALVSPVAACVLHMGGLLVLMVVELRLRDDGALAPWFYRMRMVAGTAGTLCMVLFFTAGI